MKRYVARIIVSLLLLVIAGGVVIQASAQMLTFEFSGTLTQAVPDGSGLNILWGSVGDQFSGTLSFNPDALNSPSNMDTSVISPSRTIYGYQPGRDPTAQAITMDIETADAHKYIGINPTDIAPLLIVDDSPEDSLFNCAGEYGGSWILDFTLSDPTGSGLDGTAVPANLDLNDWATHYVQMDGPGGTVVGNITALELVPEPGIETILGLGMIIWLLKRLAGSKLQTGKQ